MFKKQLLIILFIVWAQESSCFISGFSNIIKNVWKFSNHLNDVKSSKDTVKDIRELLGADDDFKEIINELKVVNHKLDNLKAYLVNKLNYITLLIEQLPAELAIQSKKDDLAKFVRTANKLWNDLTSYAEHNATDEMFNDLADEIKDNLRLQLVEFRNAIAPSSGSVDSAREGLFMLIVENADRKRDILCGPRETSHDKISTLFQIAMSTEIKAHFLLFFAHFVKYSDNDAWKMPLENDFKEQFSRSVETFSNALKIRRRPYVRSCDADTLRLDENCFGLHGYLQQSFYLLREGDTTMEDIIPLNEHSRCDGIPFNCRWISPSFRDTVACAWGSGPYRVRFFKDSGEAFGTDKGAISSLLQRGDIVCADRNLYYFEWWKAPSANRANVCTCTESRVMLLMQMTHSVYHKNYVIVGVQIQRISNYIYIQIAEGKLEANGYISDYSWVPSTRATTYPSQRPSVLKRVTEDTEAFLLGDVQLSPGHVLTSIGFGQYYEGASSFAVRIGGFKFDYKTGTLDLSKKSELLVVNQEFRRLTFPAKTPIGKTSYQETTPKGEYSYVTLLVSDLNDDYGQTTLPLLDGLPVLTESLSLIGGVGFFYRAFAENFAGLLSLRLYPLDFTYFVDTFKKSNDVDSMFKSLH